VTGPRPELAALRIADPAPRWRALGFDVEGLTLELGGIEVELGVAGHGIVGWVLRHVEPVEEIDGLATSTTRLGQPSATEHPNGAVAIDQVVVTTPDFDRTARRLAEAGLPLSRIGDAGGVRQGFRRLGPAILELVELVELPSRAPGPAAFWGLVVVARDIEAMRERLHPHLGEIRPAVQPDRHIATLAASAGLGTKVAFMDPEPTP
jgi:hypothetical protein